MSDVQELLREAVGGFEPRGDQRSIEHRVERRRRRRQVAAGLVAVGVFAAAGLLAWTAFRPAEPTVGSEESGTYLLSGFQVGPHADPATGEADPAQADARFATRWSTGAYPGIHRCWVRILDSSGSEIGSGSLDLSSLSRTDGLTMAVPVSGSIAGATATGACDPDRLDVAVTVEISNERVVRSIAGVDVAFEVEVAGDVPDGRELGALACTAAVWDEGGRLLASLPFASSGPPERLPDALDLREGSPIDAVQATVRCVPYEREDAFPEPEPPGPASTRSVTILVPDVVGLAPAEASASLRALGLAVSVTTAPSVEIASGLVAAQQPLPGVEVSTGSYVTIEISQGSA